MKTVSLSATFDANRRRDIDTTADRPDCRLAGGRRCLGCRGLGWAAAGWPTGRRYASLAVALRGGDLRDHVRYSARFIGSGGHDAGEPAPIFQRQRKVVRFERSGRGKGQGFLVRGIERERAIDQFSGLA